MLACLVVFLALPSLAAAATRHWNTVASGADWHDPTNWLGGVAPGIGDEARIGSLAGIQDSHARTEQPIFVSSLEVLDGMALLNLGWESGVYPITVANSVQVSGVNFGPGDPDRSALRLFRGPAAYDLSVNTLMVEDGAELDLRNGAIVNVGEYAYVSSGSRIERQGVINLADVGSAVTLRNDGLIDPGGAIGLTFNQLGDGLFDLDGFNGDGVLSVSGSGVFAGDGPDSLTFNGTGLSDSFSGKITLATGRTLAMNLSDGWTTDASSEIRVSASSAMGGPGRITGGHLTLGGTLEMANLFGTQVSWLDVEADTTINETAVVTTESLSSLSFDGATRILGGQYTAEAESSIHFKGVETIVRGGTFSTPSMDPNEASVNFAEATEWNGTVNLSGAVRQSGDATVAGLTVINADLFDMDGQIWLTDKPTWKVNSNLVVNAETIDTQAGNRYSGAMEIAGNFLARATINLNNPTEAWTMAGEMTLKNNLPFGAVRLGGSDVLIEGALNVDGAGVGVSADAVFAAASETTFETPSSSLLMNGRSFVESEALFFGQGLLSNGGAGQMVLADGANTDEVGLANHGWLGIGSEAGIATVDRFENTAEGTLSIDLAGYLLGDEFDHLLAADSVDLDGVLSVHLLPDGMGASLFTPVVGDEFTIVTSLGGVNGQFATVLPTHAGGAVYHWEALYHPHDVTIRLTSVTIPEPASLVLTGGTLLLGSWHGARSGRSSRSSC